MENMTITLDTHDRLVCVEYKDTEKATDILYSDHFKFQGGRIYSIIGEIGSGGWAISYLLSGKIPIEKEGLFINGGKITVGEYLDIGWYVGEGSPNKQGFYNDRSVRKQIRRGLRQSKLGVLEDDIISKFDLSRERLDCKFSYLSWERWKASAAIGYAYGKKLYCFPFLNTAILNNIITNSHLANYLNELKNDGACIIIPTSCKETLELIADDQILLNNPRFHCKQFVDEYIMKTNKQ